MNRPYSIKIFLPGGDPDGLRTIEKSNWSGAGIVIPRALMAEAKTRRELVRTGVYVLVGPAEESGLPRVYVGEGDPIKPRLDQHATKKDFWTTCIAFTSKDENLNKAHVQFIESRLITLAAQAKRCLLDNGNAPALPSMSEADAAEAEAFLAEMMLCFPLLGLNVFTAAAAQRKAILLFIAAKGIRAEGMETQDGFVVRAGSGAVKNEVPSCHAYLKQLRSALISNGVLQPTADTFVFAQDYAFQSPSTAAGVVQGRAANGRVDWRTKDGRTLKDLQEAEAKE
ncbi:MAG: GIY-YIG nuclease family protein [Armatimonadetes bacterium]|nr:GIY-YIG nuclease family protein [Chthoniobacterales bacterium]MBA3726362.1 GIY-YIG nuclease family protein [Armatimonadota bacterium]